MSRNLVITGASSPLALEIIGWALGRYERVVGVSRSTNSKLGGFAADRRFESVTLDLSHPSILKQSRDLITTKMDRIDVLINNACGWHHGGLRTTSESAIIDQINASVRGTMLLTKALLPQLEKGTKPIIINVCSTVGSGYSFSTNTLYVVLKGAIEAFGRALRNDLGDSRIRVTNLHFGKLATSSSLSRRVPLRDTVHVLNSIVSCSALTSIDSIVMTPTAYRY